MKNPAKLLWIGLVCGMMMLVVMPVVGQEVGSAVKAPPLNLIGTNSTTRGGFKPTHKRLQTQPRNLPIDKTAPTPKRAALASPQSITEVVEPHTLSEPSPATSLSFQALPDNGEVAPPDTSGAAGPSHLVVACASEIRVSDRLGNPISTKSQEVFWSGVASNIFDTRVVYDPIGQRFIMTAAADPGGVNPRLCIAVSSSSNPTNWYRWSEDVDAAGPIYADSPTLGFNKTWIVVQVNMFNKNTFEFFRSDVYAYNKANLYANGSGQRTRLSFDPSFGGSQVPAVTYDTNASLPVYLVENWTGRYETAPGQFSGFLRLFYIGGGIGSEKLFVTNTFGAPVFAEVAGSTWAEIATNDMDILPQLGRTDKIYAGDSRIQNVHYRDGILYAAQTVFVPSTAPTNAAIQWWAIAGNGDVLQFGRVRDSSGVNMFAYPSIAANRYHDVLIGYSRFSPTQYPSAAYSFRTFEDAVDELRGEALLKAGDAPYYVPVSDQNLWGDWSATTIDPVNDADFWTIQEYAAPTNAVTGSSRWGTWWGRVSPPSDLAITMTGTPATVPSGNQITYTLLVTNKLEEVVSGVRVQDTLPAGASYVSASSTKGSCTYSAGVVTCAIGTLSDLQGVTITINVTAGLPGFATNAATVFANGPDSNSSDNTAATSTEIIASADLQVQGTESPDPVHVGNPLAYTLTISNRGPSAAAGVMMTSTLPASVTIGNIAGPGQWTIDGNVITFTLGVINSAQTAVITINCTPNANGSITNQVRVAANTSDNNLANNSVNIATFVNARPVITQLGRPNINEDVPTVIPVTISDAETPAANLQFSATSSNPALIPNQNIQPGGAGQNRNLTITSAPNHFGSNTTTITVTVTDEHGAASTMVFPIDVAAVNDAPTISGFPNPSVLEDTSTNLNFTIGDIDNPVSALTLSANSSNTNLVPTSNITFSPGGASRTVSIVPATNRFGIANITIIVSDGSLSSSNTFMLTVTAVNDPPTITSIDSQTISEDTSTTSIQFIVNDPETQPTNLVVTASSSDVSIVPNANLALVNLGSTRTIRVTPATNQNGSVSITVRVSDGTNSQTTAFNVTILEINDPPTLGPLSNITTNEDAGMISVPLTGISSGAANENQPITIRASTTTPDLVENLQVIYNSPNPTGTLTFNTVANAAGTAFIDLVVSDGNVADDITRQLRVDITGVNDPPTIDQINNVSVLEDSGQRSVTLTGIAPGPANESAQTVLITATSSATSIVPHPQISYAPGSSTATLTFTPVANAAGTVTITVTLDDSRPVNSTTTTNFQITVESVNDLPTISEISTQRIAEDTSSAPIPFNFRDVEPGALTPAAFSSDQALVPDGNLLITGTGTNRNLTITPLPNQFGSATITVRVTDADGGSTTTSFSLFVDAVNDPPTLAAITNPPPIDEDAAMQTVNLSGITPGPSNESTQTVFITASSSNPSIVPHPTVNYAPPNTTGSLTYTPVANATGSVVITVTADDRMGSNNLALQTFTVRINPVNDLPTIDGNFDDKFTDEDVPLVTTITIGDVETPLAGLSLAGSSSNPELVLDSGITFSGSGATRTVTVQPLTNEFGIAFITITVSDGNGGTAEAGFVLIVNEVDDPPLIAAPATTQTIAEDTPGTFPVWVNDVDTPLGSLVLTARSSNQAVIPDANLLPGGSGTNRNVRVTPAPDVSGTANITVTVGDGSSTRTAQFTVNVSAVNDPPTLDDIPPLNIVEDAGPQLVTLTGVGPGGNETNDVLTITAVSSAPAIIPNSTGTNIGGVWKLPINPVANANGTVNMTVTVNDGRPTNATISKIFTINIQEVNDPPTLNSIGAVNLNEDAPQQNVTLTGISAGPSNESNQTLSFTATSSNPGLVINPTVSYTNGSSTAVLRFTVAPNSTGTAAINVRLSDGSAETNQTVVVNISPVNEAPVFLTTIGNLTTPEDTPISAQFVVADEETYAARLTISVTSTNPTLVPNTNMVIHGSDSNRWITITPAANLFGNNRITLTASDGTNSTSMSFNLTVTSSNDPPTLNPLPSIALTVNPPNQTINLTGISSGGGENQTNTIRVTSSNTSLVPAPSSVTYTSPNSTGSFVLNPVNTGSGSSLITVTVWDNGSPSNSFSQSFTVYIRDSANALPTLTGLSNRNTLEDTPISIPFVINDATTPVANLTVGATASNPDLIPASAISITGTTTDRILTIAPPPNVNGSTTITVWVLDDQFGYTASNFVLQVTAASDAPVISYIGPQTIDRGTNMAPVAFTISDAETPAQNLTLAATSSNQGLLPNANVILGGSGTNRSVMAYPLVGQIGSSTITITVTDANSVSTSTNFVLTVGLPRPPAVAIRRTGPNAVELRWPTDAGLYTVQGRDQLTSGAWTDIPAAPSISGTNYIVPQTIGGTNRFFRLRN